MFLLSTNKLNPERIFSMTERCNTLKRVASDVWLFLRPQTFQRKIVVRKYWHTNLYQYLR